MWNSQAIQSCVGKIQKTVPKCELKTWICPCVKMSEIEPTAARETRSCDACLGQKARSPVRDVTATLGYNEIFESQPKPEIRSNPT